jgi:CheY-like chemotaxis protein/tetratricopeptide (TPR) repeat protein
LARLLLIDEMPATRETVAEILRRLGHEVDVQPTPDGAKGILESNAPDAIFLAGRATTWSGVRALEQIRTANNGQGSAAPPVIWLDGSPPEFAGKGPEAFLTRSPAQADVQKVLADLLGGGGTRDWADLAFLQAISGPLEQFPPIRVLALAHRMKASGRMSVVTDAGRLTVDLDAGRVVHATGFVDILEFLGLHNGPDEDMGQVLGRAVAAGMAADAALNIAAQTLGARLADLLDQDGHVEFDSQARPSSAPVVLPVTIPRMLTEGLRQSRSVPKIAPTYAALRGGRADVTVPQGVALEQLGLDPVAFRLLRKAQKVPYLDILLKAEEDDATARMLAIDLLVQLGYLRLRPGSGGGPADAEDLDTSEILNSGVRSGDTTEDITEEQAQTTTRGKPKDKKAEDPRLQELRSVRDKFRAMAAADILGVEEVADLTTDVLDRKFREASQRYHPDRHSADGRGFRMVAEDIIAIVNQAYETLRDPAIQEEAKERILARKSGAVFVSKRERNQAKVAFAKGEIHFRARRWNESYEELSLAVRLDPESWRYQSLQLQAGFWSEKLTARDVSQAIDVIVKDLLSKDDHKNAGIVADLLFQVGEIWIRAGDEPRAYAFFDRAKQANPKHPATLRRLWLKQVREDGKATPPPSITAPRAAGGRAQPGGKKGETKPEGALAGIMGLFGKKK